MTPWRIGLILLVVLGVLQLKQSTTPRNQRNKNPLNIEKGDAWEGLATRQNDVRFATFVDPEHGFRAGAKILATYARRDVVTLEDIIATWAPPTENDTAGYIEFVADKTDINAWDVVTPDKYGQVMYAMSLMEGGGFTLEQANDGAALAFISNYKYQGAAA